MKYLGCGTILQLFLFLNTRNKAPDCPYGAPNSRFTIRFIAVLRPPVVRGHRKFLCERGNTKGATPPPAIDLHEARLVLQSEYSSRAFSDFQKDYLLLRKLLRSSLSVRVGPNINTAAMPSSPIPDQGTFGSRRNFNELLSCWHLLFILRKITKIQANLRKC